MPATNQEFTAQSTPLDPLTSAFVPDTVAVPPAVAIPPAVSQNTVMLGTESHETNTVTDSPSLPLDNSSIVQAQLNAISKLLEIKNQNRLPLPEPGVFRGDPLQFPIWLKAFETLIEGRATNPAERLHFLGKYVAGDARELIKGFMLLDSEDAYQKAKETLKRHFGDSFAVATAFRKKLDSWPHISSNDAQGLRNYADFLIQCEKAMEGISSLKVLNDDQENYKLSAKLPRWASVRWGRRVYEWKERNRSFPPFSEFVKDLVTESNIACDSINIHKFNKEDDSKKMKRPLLNVKNDQTREGYQRRNTLLTGSHENGQSTCALCMDTA